MLHYSASLQLSVQSVVKATPSLPSSHLNVPPAPSVEVKLFENLQLLDSVFGNGCFGSCSQMVYKDMFIVCVKKMKKDVPLHAVKSEAAVLFALNTCEFTPHCFGICLALHSIIMSYVNIDGKPVTFKSLLYKKNTKLYPSHIPALYQSPGGCM